ncbi:non-ribosomal peptide synthetase [Nocardia iowensis]|uniref:Amino acid adenylation domain-containing protein n=1 Tax=Nocardia iowensis TaxID=204891 RepID=A0ABX8RTV1_NOCIO|nr:non-ribosomal peptide synthetase [Nocardia iowensis]QXN92427.1 amino acid adenylation domain-containing protein [Nocardia iowensis]
MADDILERRKQLLERRLREQGVQASPQAQAAPARRTGEPSALSAAQRRMWFVQQLDPGDTTLNVCVAYRLDGLDDPERLQAAFATVVARHEVLRTTYHVGDDGEPYQVSRDDAAISWQHHDLTELAEAVRHRRVEVLARREFARPFDLSADLPLRPSLIRVGEQSYVLILVVHHIGWDDDSWPVFFTELNAAYRGENTLPQLTAQYVDVEVPGRSEVPSRSAAEDSDGLEFWRAALTPLPERLELPSRRAGGANSKNADRVVRQLPPELMELVAATARAQSATPYMVLLAGFQALIHRYTTATDFLVSVPVTNRRGRDAEALIGYFGNALLIRAMPRGREAFSTLLGRTRETVLAAFAHQDIGVDRVIQAVSPERVAGSDAMEQLVQVSFSVRGQANGFDLPGIDASELALGSVVAAEPLGLMVVQDGAGARVEATYQVDELEPARAAQLLDHYVQLLDSALRDPEGPIRDLDLLGETGRKDVLAISHGALVDEQPTTMIGMFERQVGATPEHIALVSDAVELSYRALNERANRLAHWLIRAGVGPEDLVALRMATSVEFVIAVLAVQKAGAAYLPIDPAYPSERTEYLLDDAAPALTLDVAAVVAAEQEAAALPDHNPVDADRTMALHPSNIAYVIYTSGSTGKPKGVPVPHDAIAEHLSGFNAEWDLTPQDRVLQSTSVSFDASLLDIFVTLTAGARVVIPKPNAYRDIPYVADLVTRHGVTVLHMVPSMLATFLVLPEVNDWRTLRRVPVGGEALPGEVADRFAAQFDAELRNHYGPTEAVVCSAHREIDGPQGTGIVSIGSPNRNVYLYLLDDAMQLVPSGVIGEIYLGGRQLARGYLNRPGLTAERFVADPFLPGGRLYRTGDLARRDDAGDIEFIGRADEQVKVRGHRIELGEVEATVTDHPSAAHCVVIVTEHEMLGPVLAAYIVPAPGMEVDLTGIRAHVAATLPEYMVPSAFAVIDAVPLTAHGKLDKRALPAPAFAERAYREPRTPTEVRIAGLFATLFTRERIGADDSFFELGGHSLLAARLITMIRAEFGIDIDMRVPFDKPTVTALAAHLVAAFRDEFEIDLDEIDSFDDSETVEPAPVVESRSAKPELVRRDRPERIPLSYSQRVYWLQRRLEGSIDGENVSYPVRFDGPLDVAALRTAIDDVVARHESLRTSFPEYEGAPYQLVAPAAPVPVPLTDISAADDIDARLAEELAADWDYVFDLAAEPMVRLRLLELGPQTHVLSILMHHIIADMRSCQIFLDDLTVAYRARLRGTAPGWSELPIQFADFAIWQREIFDRDANREVSAYGQAQLDYWRKTLDGLPDEIAVAHDHPRPAVLGRNGLSAARVLPAATWNALRARADEVGATEFMLCQAVSAAVVNILSGIEDVAIGAAVANRIGQTTDELVGLFANVVVMRHNVTGDPTPRTMLERVRSAALDAISHQGVPFERLVETLNPARSLSRNPLFQVMMHFRHRPAPVPFTADGSTMLSGIAGYYDVSFMDFHLDYSVDTNGDLVARVVVNPELYEAETGQIFADVLVGVLQAFAEQPDRSFGALDVLPEGWDTGRSAVRRAEAAVESGYVAPQTDTERTLAAILAELLEITEIGREDGFFGLGGDSVIAIKWAARAAEAGLPLSPQMVFEYFTIAELAAAVDEIIANPPAEAPDDAVDEQQHAPMAASGLDADALAALQSSWAAQR